MKRILFAAVAVIMVFSMASCAEEGKNKVVLDPNLSQSGMAAKQQEVMDTFGVSIKDTSIVGYRATDLYLEYVVVKYENGKKTGEATYYFYLDESYFTNALADYGEDNPAITADKEACYIKIASNNANTGKYESDLEKIKADFTVKSPAGTLK